MVGTLINVLIFGELWANCSPDRDAAAFLRGMDEQDPEWLAKLVREQVQRRRGVIPNKMLVRRFMRLREHKRHVAVTKLPIALGLTMLDWYVFWLANKELRRSGGIGFW